MFNLLKREKNKKVVFNENDTYINNLAKETRKHILKYDIINEVQKNPELIYKLSIDRLDNLKELYYEKISELEKEN